MNFSPLQVLTDAQKAVPAVRFAAGVAGVAAVVAIVAGFQLDPRIAVFGTIIVLGLMFVLIVLGALAAQAGASLVYPALFAAWCFVLLTVAASTMLMTSYFFTWPRSIESYLPPRTLAAQVEKLLSELSEIESKPDARWENIEPLAIHSIAIIKDRFPNQATAIEDARLASQSVWDVEKILKLQLLIVKDQLSQERK